MTSSKRAPSPWTNSIKLYERGEALKAHCDDLLKNAEMRIEKITLTAAGKPKGVAPLDAD